MPEYPDQSQLLAVETKISGYPPLVFAGEIRRLQSLLSEAGQGRAFVLQGGDCAESFAGFAANQIRDSFRVLLQMAVILTFGASVPIVKIGRIAGQFAKPRSSDIETIGDVSHPSYRGDIINGAAFESQARTADPSRMEFAYLQSAGTLNLLRAFAHGGYADLHEMNRWTLGFVARSPVSDKYIQVAERIDEALDFMSACGLSSDSTSQIHEVEFFTSHDGLLLPYEQALTRADSITGDWYACSAHTIWIGERTRQLDGAHVEFCRGIRNPIGIKIGPEATPADVIKLCKFLNPRNENGRIMLVCRAGVQRIGAVLPPLIRAVKQEGLSVVWICDPMHGNTVSTANHVKTRSFNAILGEVQTFFEVHNAEGSWPGGLHIEMTGQDVTECLGGVRGLTEVNLSERYETLCDPRLNAEQSLELAFFVAEALRRNRRSVPATVKLPIPVGAR